MMPDLSDVYRAHFDAVAARYDELRRDPDPGDVARLVGLGDLARRTVLDVGCGTGRFAALLARDHGCRVSAVDASAEMVDRACERGVPAVQARAEALPFAHGAFERATLTTVVHLLDRRVALPEIRRVLAPGGRVVIATVDPAGAPGFWLAALFPSFAAIDTGRFPDEATLTAELAAAGFRDARWSGYARRLTYTRSQALERLRGRFASSLSLLSDAEYRAGLARAERELPDPVETVLRLAVVVAGA
jgi:ubiquinone/menaquinone biosynthesis C-methylase UbiE